MSYFIYNFDISLRTLIQVTKIRSADDDSWKEMAEYVICA